MVDLDRVRPGDRVLTRELVWREVTFIRIAGERYKIIFADAPWRFSWFHRLGRWMPGMESHDDIMAVRFVALNREEPLPVDPPDEREVAFPSGQGRWLLEKIRLGVN